MFTHGSIVQWALDGWPPECQHMALRHLSLCLLTYVVA